MTVSAKPIGAFDSPINQTWVRNPLQYSMVIEVLVGLIQ
jgi:hypothetical protein